jgi:competence protein ComEA
MQQAPATPPVPLPAEPALLATWPRCVQVAVAVLLALGIGFLLGRSLADSPSHQDAEAEGPRLDLNRATRAELVLLPGLGPARVASLEEYRQAHGPFRSVDELQNVPGIGPKTLEKLRPWLFVDTPDTSRVPQPVPPPAAAPGRAMPAAPAKVRKEVDPAAPININRATAAELQKLPGIGPKISQRIIDERTLHGPFKSVDDLRRVPGIGPKTLEKLRPYITIGPQGDSAG